MWLRLQHQQPCVTAMILERLLEFSFTTKQYSGSTPKHPSSRKKLGGRSTFPLFLYLSSWTRIPADRHIDVSYASFYHRRSARVQT